MPATLNLIPLIISSYATTVVGANLLYLGSLAAASPGAFYVRSERR